VFNKLNEVLVVVKLVDTDGEVRVTLDKFEDVKVPPAKFPVKVPLKIVEFNIPVFGL
jgi:hypothetical protein